MNAKCSFGGVASCPRAPRSEPVVGGAQRRSPAEKSVDRLRSAWLWMRRRTVTTGWDDEGVVDLGAVELVDANPTSAAVRAERFVPAPRVGRLSVR